jgi:hypothetical protein
MKTIHAWTAALLVYLEVLFCWADVAFMFVGASDTRLNFVLTAETRIFIQVHAVHTYTLVLWRRYNLVFSRVAGKANISNARYTSEGHQWAGLASIILDKVVVAACGANVVYAFGTKTERTLHARFGQFRVQIVEAWLAYRVMSKTRFAAVVNQHLPSIWRKYDSRYWLILDLGQSQAVGRTVFIRRVVVNSVHDEFLLVEKSNQTCAVVDHMLIRLLQ